MAQVPKAAPTPMQIAAVAEAKNPTRAPWITEHSDKFLVLNQALEDAEHVIEKLSKARRLKDWPGSYKRKSGQDEDEDKRDISIKPAGAAGHDPESDAETSTDTESDTQNAVELLEADAWIDFWMPPWTDPDWRDVRQIKTTDIATDPASRAQDKTKRIRARLDLPQLLNRPALLSRDVAKKPTLYAKRYGVDPDRPSTTHGRSRFSPSVSATRRIHFEDLDTGLPTTVKVDYRFVIAEAGKLAGGMVELYYRLDTTPPQDANYAKYMAIKKFLAINTEDQEYQRAVFNDLSTDERINLNNADPEDPNPPPDSDLRGELHPALGYPHWKNHLNWQYAYTLDSFMEINYGFEGVPKGVYGARMRDQRTWMALQPALQLASRIVEAHPMWGKLCNILNRRLVPEARVHFKLVKLEKGEAQDPQVRRGWRKRKRVAQEWPVYIHEHEDEGLPTEKLDCWSQLEKWEEETRGTGYDIGERVWQYLQDKIQYQMGPAMNDHEEPGGGACYGITCASSTDRPLITIAVAAIWPLLVPSFTQAEKGVTAKYIASTLLHEIAHACEYSARSLVSDHWLQKEPLLTKRARDAMRRIRWELMLPIMVDELIEPVVGVLDATSELGYALEKRLWGGIPSCSASPTSIQSGYSDFTWMPMVAPCVAPWPDAKWIYEPMRRAKDYLESPMRSIICFNRLTTVAEETKLFQQAFWDSEVAKRGTKALWPASPDGGPLPTVRTPIDPPPEIFEPLMTEPVTKNLKDTFEGLLSGGFVFSSLFLREWLTELGEGHVIGNQWWWFNQQLADWSVFIDKFIIPYTARLRWAAKVLEVDLTRNAEPDVHKVAAMQLALVSSTDTVFRFDSTVQPGVTPAVAYMHEYRRLVKAACRQAWLAARETGPFVLQRCLSHLSEVQVLITQNLSLRKPVRDKLRANLGHGLATSFRYFVSNVIEMAQELKAIHHSIHGLLHLPSRGPQLDTDAEYRQVVQLLPTIVGRIDAAIDGVKVSFNQVWVPISDSVEGPSTVQKPPEFTSVPSRRFRRRRQALKKQAMREVYKMPKRVRDLFRAAVFVLGHIARKLNEGTFYANPDVDIQAELEVDLERARKRMRFPGPLDAPAPPVETFFDISHDMKRPPPPEPIARNLMPAQPQKYGTQGNVNTGSQQPQPDPLAVPNRVSDLLPEGVDRDWILSLWGGKEILAQIENPNHPQPWVYKDDSTVTKRHAAIRKGRPWTSVATSSDEDRSMRSHTPTESSYHSGPSTDLGADNSDVEMTDADAEGSEEDSD